MAEEKRGLAFIIDEPAKEDFFNTHKPVATAIAKSILLNSHLKIVGLLGRWGSGKSTIVHEVAAQLKAAQEKFLIFNYDAWLHQNDPLRRSFLESLVNFLNDQKNSNGQAVIDDAAWRKTLAKLSGAVEETMRKETPLVTSEGKFIFFLAGAVALGLSFLGLDTFRDGMGKTVTDAGVGTLFVAAALIIGPFFLWLFYWFYRLDAGEKPSFFPDHLFNRSLGPVHTLTEKNVDPTSIEFGREFRNLMKEVKANGFRLAIIIDNMDRIDDKEAMGIWANARSFFLSENDDNQLDSADFHPTLILPIDFKSIAQMFAIDSDPKKGEGLAHSFINKTFDVTFEVPAPVMSDWTRYLDAKMRDCLGSLHSDERAFRVRQFLEAWFRKTKTPITPREINKALNRLVALLMQWKDSEIPFESIAWFSINRSEIGEEIEKEVVERDHPLARFSDNWAREIAALYFGVDLEVAGQVLMTDPIQRAILANRPQDLDRYRKLPGYSDILFRVTENLPSDERRPFPNFEVITNAAKLLALETDSGPWHRSSWRNLVRAFNGITGTGYIVSPTGFAERLAPLFDRAEEAEAIDFVDTVMSIIDRMISVDNIVNATFEAAGVGGTRLIEFAEQMGLEPPIFDVEGDAPKYMRMLNGLMKYPVAQARIRNASAHEELIQEIQRRAADEQASRSLPALVKLLTSAHAALMINKPLETVDPLIQSFEGLARNNAGNSAIFMGAIRSLAAISGFDEPRRLSLERLGSDGTFVNQLSPAAEFGDEEGLAIILAVMVCVNANVGSPIGLTWSSLFSQHPTITKKINDIINDLRGDRTAIDILLGAYEANYKPRGLIEALANDRVKRNVMGPLHITKVIEKLNDYNRMIDYPLRKSFASLLSRYTGFPQRVENIAWSDGLLETARQLEKSSSDEGEAFRARLIEKAQKALDSEWITAIESGSEPYQIATAFLKPEELKFGSNSPLLNALVDSAPRVAAGNAKTLARWFTLTEILNTRGRKKALETIAAVAVQLPPKAALRLMKTGGIRLLADGGFHRRPDDTVKNIYVPLTRLTDGRDWLRDRSQQVRQILDKASESAQDEFRSIILTASKASNANKRHWGEIMARDLGIPI